MKAKKEQTIDIDSLEDAQFEIDKDAFKGPFKCHKSTKLVKKRMKLGQLTVEYEVWQCPKCKKEYLDEEQSRQMKQIWTIEKLLKNNIIRVKRNLNYDGRSYFFRFPATLSKNWHRGMETSISMLSNNEFLIKVE